MHRLGTISNINYVTSSKVIEGIADVTGPDSVMVRASASGTGGRGFDPGPRYTKDAKNGTSDYLAWRSAFTHGKH